MKLKCDILPSKFDFNLNLRHYKQGEDDPGNSLPKVASVSSSLVGHTPQVEFWLNLGEYEDDSALGFSVRNTNTMNRFQILRCHGTYLLYRFVEPGLTALGFSS